MNEPLAQALVEALGPAPFRFTPSQPVMQSPAFSWAFKLLATAIVFGAAVWLALLWGDKSPAAVSRSAAMTWFAAGVLLMLYTWWHIVTGRTRLDTELLRQTWVWDKKMELRELAYAKLIRVRGLDWLIAPRLYVRTLMGKFSVFYACDENMINDFERLVKELAEFRRMQ